MSGHVVDTTGAVLPGVTVDLKGVSIHSASSAVTDAHGDYHVERVPAGDYQVSFRLLNFATIVRSGVRVAPGRPTVENATMRLALSASVVVTGSRTFTNLADAPNPEEDLIGIATAASEGAVTPKQLESRPLLRVGELLETVPGVVISQHSGEGKANQYYLRGFNLDHGTDFATTVAGIPVNLPSNAHGQGYSDLNFVIPELVSGIQFRKGPYDADEGDFSSAGSADIRYANVLDHPIVSAGGGAEGWGRALAAASPALGDGHLLLAVEGEHDDGPWVRPDAFRKFNGVARFTRGDTLNGFAVTGMAYAGRWNASDQVPARGIASGLIPRFGSVDSTDGGDSSRVSLSADWQHSTASATTTASAYALRYRLNLLSNFTYFLDDPVNGDQFEQTDHRIVAGGTVRHRRIADWGGRHVEQTFGIDLRDDDISLLGLYHTKAGVRLSTTRQDAVVETSGGVFYQNEIQWSDRLRTIAGLRGDAFDFSVQSDNQANSGQRTAGILSPKGGVVLGPWARTEFYANGGLGYHSNDARGVTLAVDPATGAAAEPVTPLVRSNGAEVGVRTVVVPGWQSTFSIWQLDLASELVFAGDAGTTEASRPSHRAGIEWSNYAHLVKWLTLDADLARSRARFSDTDPAGPYIPGALDTVLSAGLAIDAPYATFGSLRLRYFGPRPLVEDGSVRSPASMLLNAQAGRHFGPRLAVTIDVFNLLDSQASDIDYYYRSRLPGEPVGGVDDIHTHPMQPRTARVGLSVRF